MYIRAHAYAHVDICCSLAYTDTGADMCAVACIDTFMYTGIRLHIHTSLCKYMHMYAHTGVQALVHTCVDVEQAAIKGDVWAYRAIADAGNGKIFRWAWTAMIWSECHTLARTLAHLHVHVLICVCNCIYIHAYVCNGIHTPINAYLCTYVHAHVCRHACMYLCRYSRKHPLTTVHINATCIHMHADLLFTGHPCTYVWYARLYTMVGLST